MSDPTWADAATRAEGAPLTPETPDGAFGVSAARRGLDIVVAGVLVVLAAPVVLAAALAIVLTDGRPVLFRQARVGEGGVPFRLTKLRTMRVRTAGAGVTAEGDARITRVGALLRRTSIDELPQLWDVLRGRMTLVGPRPESLPLAQRYPAECRVVLMARPGLTGPAQLTYRERSAVPPENWADVEAWYLSRLVPLRVAADLGYLHRPTLPATVRWLCLTALFVVGVVDLQAPARAGTGTGTVERFSRRPSPEARSPRAPRSGARIVRSGTRR
jgi:lipopolysaccharide/colanic/teichoic acid biosynthesis glycosyltransferase